MANGKPGNSKQRGTANAAIGGKKRKKETGSNALCPEGDPSGRCCRLGSPYSKAGTAEDSLPHPAKCMAHRAALSSVKLSIARASWPTQSGYAGLAPLKVDFPGPCSQVACARAPQLCAAHSCADSSGRSAQAARREPAADTARRNSSGGIGKHRARHNPGNEILLRMGSKTSQSANSPQPPKELLQPLFEIQNGR